MTVSPPLPAAPHSWWTVAETAMEIEPGGPTLYYRLGPRVPIRDARGRWIRDAAGRTALEAFGALPLQDMYGRLAEVGNAGHQLPRRAPAEHGVGMRRTWQVDWPELREFVATFGPLGFDWSRTFPVSNPAAKAGPGKRWMVVFPAVGFLAAKVRRTDAPRQETWANRVLIGDSSLPHDFLGLGDAGPLWSHQDDLRRIIDLVRALAKDEPDPHRIRTVAGALPRASDYRLKERGLREPIDRRWRDALRFPHGSVERGWSPFDVHPTRVDWPVAGRIMLAEFLATQLAWTRIDVGLDPLGRIRAQWTPGSLLEVIYLQLLEQVEQRLHFGIGECLQCGGPILSTRVSERTRNRAHHGCANVIRKRRQRERERRLQAREASA